MTAKLTRIHGALSSGAIIVAITGILLLLMEYGLRIMGIERLPVAPMQALVATGILPETIMPIDPPAFVTDADGFLVAGPAYLGVNSQGFRTPEFDEGTYGRKTILMIGDSFTWGYSAEPIEECFADRVRNAGYKAINLGIPSLGTAQYAASAERFVPEVKPDAVCVMFYAGNDLGTVPEVRPGLVRRYYTNAGLMGAFDDNGEPLAFEEAAHAFQGLLGADARASFMRTLRSTAIGTVIYALSSPPNTMEEPVAYVQSCLRRIEVQCAAQGAKLLLFVMPAPTAHYAGSDRVAESVAALAEFNPRVPTGFDATCFASLTDEHYNTEGHARMAQFVLEELTREGIAAVPNAIPSSEAVDPNTLRTFEEFGVYFSRTPEELEKDRADLDKLKDELAALYMRAPEGGGASPGSALTSDFVARVGGPEAAEKRLHGQRPQGSTRSYAEERAVARGRCRARLLRRMPQAMVERMGTLPPDALEKVFTGHVAFGESVLGAALQVQASAVNLQRDANVDIAWEEIVRVLELDEQQAAAVREEIHGLNLDFVALLDRPSAGDGRAPIDVARENAGAAEGDEFGRFLRTERPSGGQVSYVEIAQRNDARCREKIMALLTSMQRDRLRALSIQNLMSIKLGTDYVGDEIRRRMPAAPTATTRRDAIAWTTLKTRLNLRADQVDAVKGVLNKVKDENFAALSRAPGPASESPVMLLRRLTHTHDMEAMEKFSRYTREHKDPATGLSYAEGSAKAEASARDKLKAMLDAAQQRRLEMLGTGALADVATGHDPMRAALEAE